MLDHETFVLPSLEELTRRIGRIPRWAGATGKYIWTVLHHSFLVEAIVSDMLEGKKIRYRDNARLYCHIHDLHEGITSDVPTELKTTELREVQAWIDGKIYTMLGIPAPGPKYRRVVKIADTRALIAESNVLHTTWFNPAHAEEALRDSIPEDEAHVEFLLDLYGSPNLVNQHESRGCVDYVNAVRKGVSDCNRLSKDVVTDDGDEIIGFSIRPEAA